MSKILKNDSGAGVTISDTGVTIDDGTQYTVPEVDYLLWAESADIATEITAGNIVVNDGIGDLSVTDGINFLKYPDTAFNQRFLSEPERSNDLTAKNVQEAIEAVRTSAVGSLINPHFSATGASVINKWLGHNHPSSTSNEAPWVLPQKIEFKGVTFSNENDESDTDIEIHINGTLEHTIEIRGKRTYYSAGATFATGEQGDRVSIFLKQFGAVPDAPTNPEVGLFCKIASENAASGGTTTGD